MYKPINTNFSTKYGNNRWKSKSVKIQRDVFLSSDLEYDNWLFVECNPYVVNFCEQPFEIKLPIQDFIRSSIPDMWILYANGSEEIREVKYSSDLQNERVLSQIEVQREWCNKHNVVHKIVTEKNLRQNQLLLSNYKTIIKLLKNESSLQKAIQTKILEQVKLNRSILIKQLLNTTDLRVEALLSNTALMIFNGVISADLDFNYFGVNSEVYLNND